MNSLRFILIVAAHLACAQSTGAFADEVADQTTVESCLNCHRGPLSLQDQTTEALVDNLRAIFDDRASHPVDLPEMNDEEMLALAKALTTK